MATIPTGNFGNSVAQPGPMLQAPRASKVGAAVAAVGNTLLQQGLKNLQEETDLAEKRKRAQANTALAKTENELHDVSDFIAKGVLDGSIPADKAHAEFQTASQKITETNLGGWDSDIQESMRGRFTQVNGVLGRSLDGVIEKRQQNETLGSINSFGEEMTRQAMRDGPEAAFGRYASMVDSSGPAAGLAPAQLGVMKQNFREKVHLNFLDAAATGALEKEDLPGLKSLREGLDNNDALDPDKKSAMKRTLMSYERQVEANIQSRNAEAKYDVLNRAKDSQAMVLSGVPIPEGVAPTLNEYRMVYKDNAEARWKADVGNYLAVSDVMQQMKSSDPQQRAEMVASTSPLPGEGFADQSEIHRAVVQAKNVLEKQLYADPASYALKNSPRVQRAYKVLQDAPLEDKVAAMDFYARTTTAEQLRLGITTVRDESAGNKPRQPRILTNEQANAISDRFNDQTGGGAQPAVLVQGLEGTYGKYWPQVYAQLAGDNKLPPAGLVIPNMQDPGARARLAQASVMKKEVFEAQLSSGDLKDVKEKIQSQFESARTSFAAQGPAGARTMSAVMDEAEKLAKLYALQGKGASDAARQAYTETMGWKYDFSANYRVPKAEAPERVNWGAMKALRSIQPADIMPMDGTNGLTPEAALDQSLGAIKKGGIWVTNSDETGLRLMVQGYDGSRSAVRRKDGSPMEYTWSDLREIGTDVQR